MEFNADGNWKLYWGAGPLPTGAEAMGVITRGVGDHGALILLSSGNYVQGNAGSIRPIEQGAAKRLLGIETRGGYRAGAGRPATGAKPNRTMRLSDEEFEAVKEFVKKMREAAKMTKATGINSFEENGKFYFEDSNDRIETTELIDCDEVYYDESQGYIYNGKNITELAK